MYRQIQKYNDDNDGRILELFALQSVRSLILNVTVGSKLKRLNLVYSSKWLRNWFFEIETTIDIPSSPYRVFLKMHILYLSIDSGYRKKFGYLIGSISM